MTRPRIDERVSLGVRALDALVPCGRGQRLGIFAGSGVGKSSLLGMIARSTSAQVNVICLVGERGREVREFIERDLGPEGMARSVVVVATSDQPALVRIKAAFTATTIAEHFRDQGCDVMLMMDSVTRFAMAQREVGLAIGEPPATRGYTPSVFALLPKLLERSGTAAAGTITALYTVLVDGDDMNEPIADAVRSILDGHVVLSRQLAHAGHYPAIDVLASVSRLVGEVVTREVRGAGDEVRRLMSAYRDKEDLIAIGAYQQGTDPLTDAAIAARTPIEHFLRQRVDEPTTAEDADRGLLELGAYGRSSRSPIPAPSPTRPSCRRRRDARAPRSARRSPRSTSPRSGAGQAPAPRRSIRPMTGDRFDVDGLAAVRWGAGTPRYVLLHAGVADSRAWDAVAPALDGPSVAYDRRGFGGTPPGPEGFRHLDDLLAVLDAVAGDEPVWLIGNSMGGALAIDAALEAPERFAGLVLIGPGVSGDVAGWEQPPQTAAEERAGGRVGRGGRGRRRGASSSSRPGSGSTGPSGAAASAAPSASSRST